MIDENIILLIASTLGFFTVVLIIWNFVLQRRINRLVNGKKINLEEALIENYERLKNLENFQQKTKTELNIVQKKLGKSIRSIKTIRFNPFKGTGGGGNQSFSSAFINEHGDGVVLTGLYHRERISLFSKPIINSSSEFELAEEERRAVDEALESIQKGN